MTQQTTEVTQPELEVQNKMHDGEGDAEGEAENVAENIVKALEDAVARGDIDVQALGENVVVNFTPQKADEQDLPQLLQKTLNAIEQAKNAAGTAEQDVLFGGLEETLTQLAQAAESAAGDKAGTGAREGGGENSQQAELAEDALKIALSQQIDQGLVEVERQQDKVIVTVGAGGAFASGSAELTQEAMAIMTRIAEVNAEGESEINVSGHTDNVPLIFGSQYRDNWDLAAARSASVVQALAKDGIIDDDRLEAISYGESRPVESNDSAAGRAKNRRIEIEINY